MCAPRRLACPSSSRTSMPDPSPSTKPSRRASNGRDALVRAEVDAEARAVHLGVVEQVGVFEGLLGRGEGELAVDATVRVPLRLLDVPAEIEVLHLGGKASRKAAGVEMCDPRDPTLA